MSRRLHGEEYKDSQNVPFRSGGFSGLAWMRKKTSPIHTIVTIGMSSLCEFFRAQRIFINKLRVAVREAGQGEGSDRDRAQEPATGQDRDWGRGSGRDRFPGSFRERK